MLPHISYRASLVCLDFRKCCELVLFRFLLTGIFRQATGRNIDIEFALLGNGVRKYFDEANACVIPLNVSAHLPQGFSGRNRALIFVVPSLFVQLEQLAGRSEVITFAQTGDMDRMLSLMRSGELCVQSPGVVFNGLSLYAHAICNKGQWPRNTGEDLPCTPALIQHCIHGKGIKKYDLHVAFQLRRSTLGSRLLALSWDRVSCLSSKDRIRFAL